MAVAGSLDSFTSLFSVVAQWNELLHAIGRRATLRLLRRRRRKSARERSRTTGRKGGHRRCADGSYRGSPPVDWRKGRIAALKRSLARHRRERRIAALSWRLARHWREGRIVALNRRLARDRRKGWIVPLHLTGQRCRKRALSQGLARLGHKNGHGKWC